MATLATRPTSSRQTRHVPVGATISTILRYALLIILAFFFLIPFYLIVRNGFQQTWILHHLIGHSFQAHSTSRIYRNSLTIPMFHFSVAWRILPLFPSCKR